MPLVSGSPTQIATSKDTKAELSGVIVDGFDEGDGGCVRSEFGQPHGPIYILQKSGGPAVNGTTVLAVYQQPAMRWVSLSLLAGGGGGGSGLLQQVRYVSPNGPAVGADGSMASPYRTIQDAVDYVVAQSLPPASVREVWLIMIAPGTYDEDVVIDGTNRHIGLIGLGPWNLGLFAGVNWAPTGVPRNITWNVNAGNIDSIRHALMIGRALGFGEGLGTHVSYNTTPRISGRIIVNDNILGGTTKELYVQAQVFDAGATGRSLDYAAGTGILNFYTWQSRYASAIDGTFTQPRLQIAEETRFDGLVNVTAWSRINYCQIAAGLTCTIAAPDIQPSGMTNTNFAGTFTGPAASCRLDGNTNYWFKTNGAVLGGAATKVIQDDLVP